MFKRVKNLSQKQSFLTEKGNSKIIKHIDDETIKIENKNIIFKQKIAKKII